MGLRQCLLPEAKHLEKGGATVTSYSQHTSDLFFEGWKIGLQHSVHDLYSPAQKKNVGPLVQKLRISGLWQESIKRSMASF